MAKIFVVEDDENISELIRTALCSASYEVESFERGDAFEKRIQSELPDLVLLDIMLPGKSGTDLLRALRGQERTALLPVIFLTARSTEFDKASGLELGADDYITKPFGVLELLARIKAVLRRAGRARTPFDTPVQKQYKDLFIDTESRQVSKDGQPIHLTFKEYELFLYMYRNRGVVLSRENILEKVWGYEYSGDTTRTVDMHIKSLRQKLGNNAEEYHYIETVRGYGYKMVRDEK